MQETQLPERLFHFTAPDAYQTIFRDGLKSTNELLLDFEVEPARAAELVGQPRPEAVTLGPHPKFGTARLSHSAPLLANPVGFAKCLKLGGNTMEEFGALMADRVFFWTDELDAGAYQELLAAEGPYDRITFRTKKVLQLAADEGREVQVSRFNTGVIPRTPAARGPKTWTSIEAATKAKELVVLGRIDRISEAAVAVTHFDENGVASRSWPEPR